MRVTALVPRLADDRAAKIATRAHREGITPREAMAVRGDLTAEESDAPVRPAAMAGGGGCRPQPATEPLCDLRHRCLISST